MNLKYEPLVSIEKVQRIEEIPGADNIFLAFVAGRQIVVERIEVDEGQIAVGGECVFVRSGTDLPVDSPLIVPGIEDGKVKNSNFKGVKSEGMIYPTFYLDFFNNVQSEIFSNPRYGDINLRMWRAFATEGVGYYFVPIVVGSDISDMVGAKPTKTNSKKSRARKKGSKIRQNRSLECVLNDDNFPIEKKKEIIKMIHADKSDIDVYFSAGNGKPTYFVIRPDGKDNRACDSWQSCGTGDCLVSEDCEQDTFAAVVSEVKAAFPRLC